MHTRTRRPAAPLLIAVGAVLALTGGLFATPALAASGDDAANQVSWGVRPADNDNGESRPNFVYALDPGDSLEDGILVRNLSEEALDLAVYAADGLTTDDGALDLITSGEESVELGSWITMAEDSITIEPGESTEVPFELTVPEDAQPGDYAAGVVASMRVEGDNGVVTERRLGSRVLLRVSGELSPALTISHLQTHYDGTWNPFLPGSGTVEFTLTNTGNATLEAGAELGISGLFGWGQQALETGDLPEILPGANITRTVEVAELWPLVTLTTDLDVTAQAVVREGAVPPPTAEVLESTSAQTWAVPWTIVIVIVALILLIVWQILAARRRKRAHARDIQAAVEEALATLE